MSASEFAFLALGLVLGAAMGAALVIVLRARPRAPREVRVTVAPDSLARPTSTLAHQPLPDGEGLMAGMPPPDRVARATAVPTMWPETEPVPAIPASAERPVLDAPRALALGLGPPRAARASADGTSVRSAPMGTVPPTATAPVADGPLLRRLARVRAQPPGAGPGAAGQPGVAGGRPPVRLPERTVAIPVERVDPREDPMGAGLAGVAQRNAIALAAAVAPLPDVDVDRTPAAEPAGAGGVPDEPSPPDRGMIGEPGGAALAMSRQPAPDPCADLRRTASERREVADVAASAARVAADALRDAQRAYDEHVGRGERAEQDADPRAVRAAKDVAQRTYHEARARAGTAEDAESAARAWLQEINAINRRHRDARAIIEREQAAGRELLPRIERLALEADAARISAEKAAVASREASEAVAACEEAALAAPDETSIRHEVAASLAASEGTMFPGPEGLPLIVAILRGDQAALERAISELAAGDAEEARRWRLRLADLADAIVSRAIEAAHVDLPDGHRFWGPFTRSQRREIVAALASLGYRFDGLGGFADERAPSQRDLSLAVGYAGMDPMRIRVWPSEAEMPNLYREAVVAADEWLAEECGELTLGEMVDGLGRRADELADVWNAWGRVRPILLHDA